MARHVTISLLLLELSNYLCVYWMNDRLIIWLLVLEVIVLCVLLGCIIGWCVAIFSIVCQYSSLDVSCEKGESSSEVFVSWMAL